MKKALIYLSAFCVSFLTIYSIYYYSKVFKMQQALVVEAGQLKNTTIGSGRAAFITEGNAIYTSGVVKAIHLNRPSDSVTIGTEANHIPDKYFVGGEGVYGIQLLNSYDSAAFVKYKNHPPIDFNNMVKGDSLVFSYLFQQLMLPKGFYSAEEWINFGDKEVRALLFRKYKKNGLQNGRFYQKDGQMLLTCLLRDSQQVVWYSNTNAGNIITDYAEAEAFMKPENEVLLDDSTALLLPDVDFFIQKSYKPEELTADHLPIAHKKLVQERMKLKTTAPVKDPQEWNGDKIYFKAPMLFYIKNPKDSLPYFALLARDSELFVKNNLKKKK